MTRDEWIQKATEQIDSTIDISQEVVNALTRVDNIKTSLEVDDARIGILTLEELKREIPYIERYDAYDINSPSNFILELTTYTIGKNEAKQVMRLMLVVEIVLRNAEDIMKEMENQNV